MIDLPMVPSRGKQSWFLNMGLFDLLAANLCVNVSDVDRL